MGEFLANMIRALGFVLKETSPQDMFEILADLIKNKFDASILERNIENFIAYFRVVSSGKHAPKMLIFDRKLVQAFITRTDTGIGDAAADSRAERLYMYLSCNIEDGAQITDAHLSSIHEEFVIMKMPSLKKVLENIRIAMMLKWVQGPLMKRLSHSLQDHIVVLGTVYGECKKSLISNVEWPELIVSPEDRNVLADEYRIFEETMKDALNEFKTALAAKPDPIDYEAQFQVVFNSLERLAQMEASGTLDSIDSFKDRIIVSSSLIYIQDDYVVKSDKLRQLIRLFVSMYIKYRDKRYTPANT
jgi:hypothetical protein